MKLVTFKIDQKSLSISHRGAWGQVAVAGVLITLLPAMICVWGWQSQSRGVTVPSLSLWFTGAGVIAVIILGYTLLFKYPVSIVRLRHYLGVLAGGEIPGLVTLSQDENDLAAVQTYLERIIKMAEDRIQMIQKQHIVELEAERQRVMVESIGTMCHHLGQPTTIMSMNLYRLRNHPAPAEVPLILAECEESYNTMCDIFDKLRGISRYCPEAYIPQAHEQASSSEYLPDLQIVKV